MSSIYAGDIGTEIILDTGSDISTAASTTIVVKKPDGTVVEWAADIYQTNCLRYVTMAGDLNEVGIYKLQAKVSLPNWSGLGKVATFQVYPGLA